MQELKGNVWNLAIESDAICITTNGTIKKNGECVMGRGIAMEAKQRDPKLPLFLGTMISSHGNCVFYLGKLDNGPHLVSFPVKHNWYEEANMELISRSYNILLRICQNNLFGINRYLLPRPGCGNGKLDWDTQVKPMLLKYQENSKIHIVSF